MSESRIVVTACDPNFLWGSYLLVASLRYHNVAVPVRVISHGLDTGQKRLLEQFNHVRVVEHASDNPRNIACQKAEAVLAADAEQIAWIDSDCVVTGDITRHLETPEGSIQIRMRPAKEVAYLFRDRYQGNEQRGQIPQQVLDIWRRDVGEQESPRIRTSCNAFCFVVHRTHKDFIRSWEHQIQNVVPPRDQGIVNDRSFAYFLLDEAVLSSMLAFAKTAPSVADFRLGSDPEAQVVHFGGSPKPWEQWLERNLNYFDLLVSIVDWCVDRGLQTPPRPWNLFRENRSRCERKARSYEVRRSINGKIHAVRRAIRRLLIKQQT